MSEPSRVQWPHHMRVATIASHAAITSTLENCHGWVSRGCFRDNYPCQNYSLVQAFSIVLKSAKPHCNKHESKMRQKDSTNTFHNETLAMTDNTTQCTVYTHQDRLPAPPHWLESSWRQSGWEPVTGTWSAAEAAYAAGSTVQPPSRSHSTCWTSQRRFQSAPRKFQPFSSHRQKPTDRLTGTGQRNVSHSAAGGHQTLLCTHSAKKAVPHTA